MDKAISTITLFSAALQRSIGYHQWYRASILTHLYFEDYLFIFFDGLAPSLQGILCILQQFYQHIGLKLNLDKFELFLGGIAPLVASLLESLGFKCCSLPIRYLGVSLIYGRLSTKDCVVLVNHIVAQMRSWTMRYLSFEGRLQLVSCVISHMLNF